MASLITASWNQLVEWLKRIATHSGLRLDPGYERHARIVKGYHPRRTHWLSAPNDNGFKHEYGARQPGGVHTKEDTEHDGLVPIPDVRAVPLLIYEFLEGRRNDV